MADSMNTQLAGVYSDFTGLSKLQGQARSEPEKAAHEVAQQFESLFVGMMMKSMRDATPKGGLFQSDQMEAYQDMFDKQLSVDLSKSGGLGLAEIIERQINANNAQ